MIISGMHGLGDNIYQRSFVKELPKPIWLNTSWPEIYHGIEGINFVKPVTRLRTQLKNVNRQKIKWVSQPRGPITQVSYGDIGIMAGMQRAFKVRPKTFDLPDYGPSPVSGKYVVVRPATIRSEWLAESRNPLPEYLCEAVEVIRVKGYKIVSVSDFEHRKEWPVEPLPYADIKFHYGELSVTQLMSLVQGATAVIGGVGWLVPAAIAYKTPAWIVCGGWGHFNAPEKLVSPIMDLSHITFVKPDNFCLCRSNNHKCDKRIENHGSKFTEWAEKFPTLV